MSLIEKSIILTIETHYYIYMIPNPGTQKCTLFLWPLQNAATRLLVYLYLHRHPLGKGLCYLWAKAPVPRHIGLKKWSQNLYKVIVFLIFPTKENASRSTGAQSDLLSRASELSSKKENIALCTALGMV